MLILGDNQRNIFDASRHLALHERYFIPFDNFIDQIMVSCYGEPRKLSFICGECVLI